MFGRINKWSHLGLEILFTGDFKILNLISIMVIGPFVCWFFCCLFYCVFLRNQWPFSQCSWYAYFSKVSTHFLYRSLLTSGVNTLFFRGPLVWEPPGIKEKCLQLIFPAFVAHCWEWLLEFSSICWWAEVSSETLFPQNPSCLRNIFV